MPLSSSQDGGRVGGAADDAVAVSRSYLPNHLSSGGLVVGVVDTGFPVTEDGVHPWLDDHIEYGDSDVEPVPSGGSTTMLGPRDGHGTFVTGLIVREAPAVRVRMVRPKAWLDMEVGEAIATLSGCTLVNLSFFGDDLESNPPAQIVDGLRQLGRDAVVVVAAGNERSAAVTYPAGIDMGADGPRVISVGAVDETHIAQVGASPLVADFSNYGSWVDCYANGVQVLGTHCRFAEDKDPTVARAAQTFRGWALWSGTSFAAATVTGRIARIAMDRRTSAREAAKIVLRDAEQIPVPNENSFQVPDWRPFVRGVASTWGKVDVFRD